MKTVARLLAAGAMAAPLILTGCATGEISTALPDPVSSANVSTWIDIQAAVTALDGGDRRLATDLLGELVDRTSGVEHRFIVALLLEARGQRDEAGIEMKALALCAEEAPEWLRADLVQRLAQRRLADRRAESEQGLQLVLERYYEARGGLEGMRALTDMVAYGLLRTEGVELRFRLARKRPRFLRIDIYTRTGLRIEGNDGQTPWLLVPPYQSENGTFFEGRERVSRLENSHFDDVLVRFKETRERLHLAPGEMFEDREVDRIEIDYPSERTLTVLLDRTTGLDVQRVKRDGPDEPPTTVTIEYAHFDGRMLPARQVVESPAGTVDYVFERYDFETSLDPRAFDIEEVRLRLLGKSGSGSPDPTRPAANDSR